METRLTLMDEYEDGDGDGDGKLWVMSTQEDRVQASSTGCFSEDQEIEDEMRLRRLTLHWPTITRPSLSGWYTNVL
jgi:hypothetical protein